MREYKTHSFPKWLTTGTRYYVSDLDGLSPNELIGKMEQLKAEYPGKDLQLVLKIRGGSSVFEVFVLTTDY